jgi:uncharacterized protein (DUF885 family)
LGLIDDIADRYVDDHAALDPITATGAGISGHDHEMPDLSPEGYSARADLDRRTLAELSRADAADAREQVAKDAMIERLALRVELYDAGEVTGELNVLASPVQAVRQAFDLMPTGDVEAVAAYAARMAAVPEAYEGYRRGLLTAAADGHVAALRQVRAAADQCATWSGGTGEDFYGALATRLAADDTVPETLRTELHRAAGLARAATAELGEFLRSELTPLARTREAAGREAYALHSRYFLGAHVDLDETYAWGWSELGRLRDDMTRVAGEIVPGGTVADAIAALDADPSRKIAGKEKFRDWMQRLGEDTIARLHGVHFDIPEPARRLEARIAPTTDGVIYYTAPSEDFTRPGRMWWSVPAGIDEFSTWREVTTVFHEGVPGHHLQVAQAVYRADRLNRWQRLLCWVSGHGEGWALYAERLMADLGYLDDPGERLGMLDAQLFRAARVIVDIGMHLELRIPDGVGFHDGEVWTPELGFEFMRANCAMPDEFLRFELNRYLGWPGQAPSYKVGERIWLAARDEARARHGAAFDLKQFHRDALDLGSLGLDPLREALARL